MCVCSLLDRCLYLLSKTMGNNKFDSYAYKQQISYKVDRPTYWLYNLHLLCATFYSKFEHPFKPGGKIYVQMVTVCSSSKFTVQ